MSSRLRVVLCKIIDAGLSKQGVEHGVRYNLIDLSSASIVSILIISRKVQSFLSAEELNKGFQRIAKNLLSLGQSKVDCKAKSRLVLTVNHI